VAKKVGPLLAQATLLNVPFFQPGGLKVVYDLRLYRGFRAIELPGKRESPLRERVNEENKKLLGDWSG
jgi:hypothetical protein